jgi:hypothetical protein
LHAVRQAIAFAILKVIYSPLHFSVRDGLAVVIFSTGYASFPD